MYIKASIIIPTYNRGNSLQRALKSLSLVKYPKSNWEVIVVDNNSSDDTKAIVSLLKKQSTLNIKYVIEKRLSFTVARQRGAKEASGEILVYIDDDVTVEKKWLSAIIKTFDVNKIIGMVGGPVKPVYEIYPPQWVLNMPDMWLSLYDRGDAKKEVEGIPGPNLSIRKSILYKVGGFPPDTIGVEQEGVPGTINKIYIGPGDWGLCQKVKLEGYKIIYEPQATVYHHIPPIRLTKSWWRSRFKGEGCYIAFTNQHNNPTSRFKLISKSIISSLLAFKRIIYIMGAILRRHPKELYTFEISYFLSKAKVEFILATHKDLAEKFWEIGLKGVVTKDYKKLINLLS